VVQQTRRGKGNALTCGYAACEGDIIVTLDADGSMDGAEIPRFVEALCDGADFVKGSRHMDGGGSIDFTAVREWGNRSLTWLVNRLYGTRYSDLTYGYNAFWARCLPHLDVNCDGFAYEILVNCRIARLGLRVREVPSFERQRIHGSSKLNAFRDGWAVLKVIVWERFQPLREHSDLGRPIATAFDEAGR
jgi:glycosyltransferase involved in cell wall biosynthesis